MRVEDQDALRKGMKRTRAVPSRLCTGQDECGPQSAADSHERVGGEGTWHSPSLIHGNSKAQRVQNRNFRTRLSNSLILSVQYLTANCEV